MERLHDIACGSVELHVWDSYIDLMEANVATNACASLPCASPDGWLRVIRASIFDAYGYLALRVSAFVCLHPLHSPLIGLRAFCCQLTSSRLWRDVSLSSKPRRHRKPIAATASVDIMYQITNIYALAAFGTIGGALFGFDVSSMSAWIDRDQYLKYFDHPDSNTQGGVSSGVPYACCRQVQH
jgi:hypothetical protein